MTEFEKDLILSTFLKCFGLRSAFIKYVELNDSTMIDECIDSLAKQSGLRESFIKENLTEILTLGN